MSMYLKNSILAVLTAASMGVSFDASASCGSSWSCWDADATNLPAIDAWGWNNPYDVSNNGDFGMDPDAFYVGDSGGGDSGGGGDGPAMVVSLTAPDMPDNPTEATCHSDTMTRETHAQEDARYLAALRYPQRVAPGTIVTVTYDDGGTEDWIWTGMTAPLGSNIPGSLNCP